MGRGGGLGTKEMMDPRIPSLPTPFISKIMIRAIFTYIDLYLAA